MISSLQQFKEAKFKEPMVMLPFSQYETMLEYMEDMEDRLAIKERANEENIPWEEVEKKFKKKFKVK